MTKKEHGCYGDKTNSVFLHAQLTMVAGGEGESEGRKAAAEPERVGLKGAASAMEGSGCGPNNTARNFNLLIVLLQFTAINLDKLY